MADRIAKIERKTRETDIAVELNLDGTGSFDVECDIQFLKHMVETFARYSNIDIRMRATGDNDHHLIEDVAISIGKAFAKALDDSPIERMATATVVMDDAMVMTSLDIVDRPYCETDIPDPLYLEIRKPRYEKVAEMYNATVIAGDQDKQKMLDEVMAAIDEVLPPLKK